MSEPLDFFWDPREPEGPRPMDESPAVPDDAASRAPEPLRPTEGPHPSEPLRPAEPLPPTEPPRPLEPDAWPVRPPEPRRLDAAEARQEPLARRWKTVDDKGAAHPSRMPVWRGSGRSLPPDAGGSDSELMWSGLPASGSGLPAPGSGTELPQGPAARPDTSPTEGPGALPAPDDVLRSEHPPRPGPTAATLLHDVALPVLQRVVARLLAHGHEVTLHDDLYQDDARLTLRLRPRTPPLQRSSASTSHVARFELRGTSTSAGQRGGAGVAAWGAFQETRQLVPLGDASAEKLTPEWVAELAVAFVERVLADA